MTTNRLAALALFAGTAAGLITMALHPTARDFMPGGAGGAYARNVIAHSLALFAQPLIISGTLALTLRLRARRDVAVAGFAFFAMAAVAVMIAGVASGFLAPEFLHAHGRGDGAAAGIDALNYTAHLNRAFAKVYVGFSAIGILLWSAAMLAGRELSRGLAIYGVALATGLVLGITTGLLRLDVHGFGLVVLGQGIWFVWVGALLWRASSAPTAPSS